MSSQIRRRAVNMIRELREEYSKRVREEARGPQARGRPSGWDETLLAEAGEEPKLSVALYPEWTGDNLSRPLSNLAMARRDVHECITVYLSVIHGTLFGDNPNVYVRLMWLDSLRNDRRGRITQKIVDIDAQIGNIYGAETLWGGKLARKLATRNPHDLAWAVTQLDELIRKVKSLVHQYRLPDRSLDAPRSINEAKKWIVVFGEVLDELTIVMSVLFVEVAGVSSGDCRAVMPM